jgi:predicted signal transduction protein with EAL and GGDEF domain
LPTPDRENLIEVVRVDLTASPVRECPTVLVADDDPAFRLMLGLALEQADFRVEEATNGRTALEVFERTQPDLVLLDILMPDLDGYSACRALRATPRGRSTPVLMLTSLDDTESIARAYDIGATDFITKPVNYLILTQRLRYILRANRYFVCHDELTGLPTRNYFLELLQKILATAKRRQESMAVLSVSLDHFKRFNENLGNAVGDELLRQVADRLGRAIRSEDLLSHCTPQESETGANTADGSVVARLGGDEFSIVLRQVDHLEHSAVVARRILSQLHRPFSVGRHELHVTASIGISAFPLDGNDPEALLRHAEIATHHAKTEGGNRIQFHTESLNAGTQRRFSVESRLRKALATQAFELHYQPKLTIPEGRVTGVEALLRWRDEELGPVSPAEFIPVAEESGLIVPLGNWVLESAFRQLRAWHDEGRTELTMAINVSPVQFRKQPLVQRIAALLRSTGVNPAAVELEVTEGLLMEEGENTLAALNQLKDLGLCLAVDDFGTGYSSLSYLKRFPLDTLKMDRSFVQDLRIGSRDLRIASAIVHLARSLEMRVVAEGVEHPHQLDALCAAACDEAQGFLFCKPLPVTAMNEWLAARSFPVATPGAREAVGAHAHP